MFYRVDIIESEASCGQRIDESRFFDTKEEAICYVQEFNAKNDKNYVPDWYMFADKPIAVSEKRE